MHTMPHPQSRNVVASCVVLDRGGCPLRARSHAVAVILADEDARQFPQLGDVVRLEYLPLSTVNCIYYIV